MRRVLNNGTPLYEWCAWEASLFLVIVSPLVRISIVKTACETIGQWANDVPFLLQWMHFHSWTFHLKDKDLPQRSFRLPQRCNARVHQGQLDGLFYTHHDVHLGYLVQDDLNSPTSVSTRSPCLPFIGEVLNFIREFLNFSFKKSKLQTLIWINSSQDAHHTKTAGESIILLWETTVLHSKWPPPYFSWTKKTMRLTWGTKSDTSPRVPRVS